MTGAAAERERLREELCELVRLLRVKRAAQEDPKVFINEIRFFDPAQADDEEPAWVEFKMFPPEDWEPPRNWDPPDGRYLLEQGALDWYWQSLFIDWIHDPNLKKYLVLKARQLGITLLLCAYALWLMLFRPGAVCVAYSYTEDEAKKLVEAAWAMFSALPAELRNHVEVVTPKRAELPSEWIRLRHRDGRVSTFQALPATPKHGHGARVTFAIMDEVAYMDHGRRIYTAINPATTRGRAKLALVSTAYGVSNQETGEGNFFHHLYATQKSKKLAFKFLPWNLEPTRDQGWYENEALKLDEVERNQQYPLNPNDAFMLSGELFFNRESLEWYRANTMPAKITGQFVKTGSRRGRFVQSDHGVLDIWEKPHPESKYAIGVDSSTGKAADYTSADVIDLSSGAIVAHFHAKMEAPRVAEQLWFLGHYYNHAKICPERQGGYGEALIAFLREGVNGLPAYTNLYRHKKYTRSDKPISEDFGHPMGEQSRAEVLDGLKDWLRQRLFPWLSQGHVDELGTFVYADTKPSPRAQDGCNDDRVMSLALAVKMFREFGQVAHKKKKPKKRPYVPPPIKAGAH